MKLIRFCVKGFRGYQEKTCIDLNDLTTIIGKNDSGKSTVLEAMDTFFNNIKMDAGDYNINLGDTKEIRLTAVFSNLPDEVVIDETNPINLAEEYLLNSDGYLEIEKVYKGAAPSHKETYIIANHPSNENFSDLLKLKITPLKTRARELDVNLDGVNQTMKSEIRKRIWESIELEFELQSILVKDEDTKKIGEKLEAIYPTYSLFKSDRPSTDQDAEAQDPMQVAIKEAMKAQEARLNVIARRVQREVEAVANRTVEKLQEMDLELANELNPVFKTDWGKVFKLSLTSDEQIPINKRGSGVRRLILLNFFRVKAEQQNSTNIIYAIEEPETSQHPDNQKMLIEAFWELSQQDNTQVLFTTHTPMLTNHIDENNIRYIKNNEIINTLDDELKIEIANSLGVLPDHKVKLFIGVEGVNDINGLKNFSKVISREYPELIDLDTLENDGKIVFIPLGGSSFKLWINRLNGLNIPEFHICDRDYEPPTAAHYQTIVDELNTQEDKEAYITSKRELESYIHHDVICSTYANYDIEIRLNPFDDFDDVPLEVAKKVHEASTSPHLWDELTDEKKKKKISACKKVLNSDVVKEMTYEQYCEADSGREIEGHFRRIIELVN
ncbi:ATP-binding protein [Sulfurovum lithotrophicum]|uniref:ATP-binding protein n=1 Tax=Sulfurovum lithotrophicum TaxID=206403 RepID=UPI0006984978|nr:ATP-binding protein [Sulfurovum lithotrophicum]